MRGALSILGVDPGTLATGWGVVVDEGGRLRHVAHGVVRTRSKDPLWVRLKVIYDALEGVLGEHQPAALSLEQCFVSRNVQSALKLGHARGAVMVACVGASLDVHEYTASRIKSAVAGSGRADKRQVQEMVRMILGLGKLAPEDASDALAAAICHAHAAAFRPTQVGR